MSSATFAGILDSSVASDFCFASGPVPPPPPPPPPVSGQVPTMKIESVDSPHSRRSQLSNNDRYEPPVVIQNAMMSKDKKPFTYTPGMGGKLDLSQIRSPRMARRVAKNANDEGIDGLPKSPLATEQTRPVSTSTNLFIQPQVAVPVFPAGNVPSTPVTRGASRNSELTSQPNTPDTVSTSPQVILSKAPTPWLQNKNKTSEELPEWAKRNIAANESSSPSSMAHICFVPSLTLQNQTVPPRQQSQQRIQMRPVPLQSTDHDVSIQVEDRPSVFSVVNEPGHHHQFQNSTQYQQLRSNSRPVSPPVQATKIQPQLPGSYIVPMVLESGSMKSPNGNSAYQQQPGWDYAQPVQAPNQIRGQLEPGPVQSRSFRVLQKITDTDDDNINVEQIRKLQLTEDDKLLMNKFKEQVDGDTFLHQEEDPRYRGATIPSRAFRCLQNMTDVADGSTDASRGVNKPNKKENRKSQSFEEAQVNLPASEQQVQEPKKYTGSAIPSRSFKILQAMTTPESFGPDTTDY
ncbi:uncharacterized protein LOC122849681 isoform X3 [Aphidius gifuensis]|uniref:uncharacterized protein LOC122849681 isoform X3 n=1 Tax=Aphidius gifuensis TaxID=684658 RepID=UPI001CDC954B|nr:uncharacterized protein LOC122849681 isoform X3 [Aphidius gifuensis]